MASSDLLGGGVHRLAALDDRRRAEAPEETHVPLSGRDGDDVGPRVSGRAGEPRLALRRLDVHVLDVDLLDDAERRGEREHPAGVVGVDVNLHRARRADDEERVAEVAELALDRVGIDLLALDEEARAVPVARELEVDRLDRERRLRPRARSGSGSPRSVAAIPRTISRSPAPPASTHPRRGGSGAAPASREGLLPGHERGQEPSRAARPAERLGALGELARDREDRPLLRLAHRGVAASAAERNAAARAAPSTLAPSSASAAPRTSWERITPEFPRAPIRRGPTRSRADLVPGRRPATSSASRTARTVKVMFVPVSPSGTG